MAKEKYLQVSFKMPIKAKPWYLVQNKLHMFWGKPDVPGKLYSAGIFFKKVIPIPFAARIVLVGHGMVDQRIGNYNPGARSIRMDKFRCINVCNCNTISSWPLSEKNLKV
jgi:hypothetical protein